MDFNVSADVSADVSAGLNAAASVAGDVGAAISAGLDVAASIGGDISGSIGGSFGADAAIGAVAGLGLAATVGLAAGVGGRGSIDIDPLAGLFGGGSTAREDIKDNKQLAKAIIWNEDTKKVALTCLFNPEHYTLKKTNTWGGGTTNIRDTLMRQHNVALTDFKGGQPMTLQFDIYFDTYLIRNPEDPSNKDVRYYTDKLFDLMKIANNLENLTQGAPAPPAHGKGPAAAASPVGKMAMNHGRPPLCSFHWGPHWTWAGAITSVNIDFTLFDRDGTPMRAKATVQMQQVRDSSNYPKQNPTSGGDALRAGYVVQPGDTLDLIAHQQYGDPTRWRILAAANNLEDPRALRPGQRLRVP